MSDQPDASFFQSFFQSGSRHAGSKVQTCSKYDDFYNLTHPNRGVALIFNHREFDDRTVRTRNGTENDRDRLESILKELQFEVRVYNDLHFGELFDILKTVSKEDHSENDCFVVCVMSHGGEGKIYAKDHSYSPTILWEYYTGDRCGTLAGKPKMFFIQACRGEMVDEGVQMRDTIQADASRIEEREETYMIPIMADILIMNATYEGYYSWRNPQNGSWFIQSLCDVLERYAGHETLLNMLTLVNKRVALDYQSNVPKDHTMHKKRQICTIVSMLTRFMAFPPKSTKSTE